MAGDQLEIYFASNRPGGTGRTDIYRATRATTADNWSSPVEVPILSTTGVESTLALSSNGLFILLGSEVDDPNNDIYMASRTSRQDEFGLPVALSTINSTFNESASWVSDDGLTIWVHSDRDGGGSALGFDVYESTRPNLSTPFTALVQIESLSNAEATEISATRHGRFAILAINDGSGHDLFVAPRLSSDTSSNNFGSPIRLVGPNTEDNETDAWLAPDGCTLFFARGINGGGEQLHEARCVQ